jgi:putative Holliday junction resolvase
MENTKVIMGLDYGERRIGVSISDISHTLAGGYGTIDCKINSDFFSKIGDILKEHDVGSIVVGYPILLDGNKGQKALAVDTFARELEIRFGLPVYKEDERFSSHMAQSSLKQRGSKKKTPPPKGGY